MASGDKDCLDQRIPEIKALMLGDALFQAGAMINGGRRCAGMQTCGKWDECAHAHGALWDNLSSRLSESK